MGGVNTWEVEGGGGEWSSEGEDKEKTTVKVKGT